MVVLTIIVVPLVLRGRVLVEAGETVDQAVRVVDGVLQGLRPTTPPRQGRDDLCGNQRAVPTAIALTRHTKIFVIAESGAWLPRCSSSNKRVFVASLGLFLWWLMTRQYLDIATVAPRATGRSKAR